VFRIRVGLSKSELVLEFGLESGSDTEVWDDVCDDDILGQVSGSKCSGGGKCRTLMGDGR